METSIKLRGITQMPKGLVSVPNSFQLAWETTGQLFYDVIDNPNISREDKELLGQAYISLRNFVRQKRGEVLIDIKQFLK